MMTVQKEVYTRCRANLSDIYFDKRQDRYMLLKNTRLFADFFDSLVSTVSTFSYKINPDGLTYQFPPLPPADGSSQPKEVGASPSMHLASPHSPPLTSAEYKTSVHNKIQDFISFYRKLSANIIEKQHSGSSKEDTWIFPTIQMGTFSIRQDEKVTRYLLGDRSIAPGPDDMKDYKLYLSSPYFNMTENYTQLVLNNRC